MPLPINARVYFFGAQGESLGIKDKIQTAQAMYEKIQKIYGGGIQAAL